MIATKTRALTAGLLLTRTLFSQWVDASSTKCGNHGLRCYHGGKCTNGSANFDFLDLPDISFLQEVNVHNQSCECPEGHTGVSCDHKYTICENGDNDGICFHGSTCVADQSDASNFYCDCAAMADDGKEYAGKYCEIVSTTLCPESDLEGIQWFCTNEGTCREKETDINRKCKCQTGFHGPHCEYDTTFTPKKCSLSCQNGGKCKLGLKDYGSLNVSLVTNVTNVDGMHCVCKKGYTGVRCDIPIQQCGDKSCFHGSSCLTYTDPAGNVTQYCDCSTAGSGDMKGFYAGNSCEYNRTTVCSDSSGSGINASHFFCTNNGTCGKAADDNCKCPNGYVGPRCEFLANDAPECTLLCANGGDCKFGLADFGIAGGFQLPFLDQPHSYFMHCSCPPNYTGLTCEIDLNVCGTGQHVCAYGSSCVLAGKDDNGEDLYQCNCTDADTDLASFAGKHCEYAATTFCKDKRDKVRSFCANGGKCKTTGKSSDSHEGCNCPDDFDGEFCELKMEIASSSTSTSPKGAHTFATIFSVALFLVVAILGAAIVVARNRRRNANLRRPVVSGLEHSTAVAKIDADGSSTMKADDDEDGELKDVEII